MKVLAIISGPQKGSSYKIVRRLENKMKRYETVEFEYLILADAHLEACLGCLTCVIRGEERCQLKDDRPQIEAKMLAADGIVFATPSYCCHVSALAKRAIDRLAYLERRPRLFHQCALAIATTHDQGLKETLHYLSRLLAIWGCKFVGKLGVVVYPPPATTRVKNKIDAKIADTAGRFYRVMKRNAPPVPSLDQLVHFQTVRGHVLLAREHFPADYAYLQSQGLLSPGTSYFIESKVGRLKSLYAGMLAGLRRGEAQSR